jgi:hypothetical protein
MRLRGYDNEQIKGKYTEIVDNDKQNQKALGPPGACIDLNLVSI